MERQERVRVIKEVRLASGRWQFVPLRRNGNRNVWDERPGVYFLDWREEGRRRREAVGMAPNEALEAQRRKKVHALVGADFSGAMARS